MRAFRTLLGGSDMLAYLAMMAPRLVELRRVLKETGSIYLHCDPTASHYLKLVMDAVFGPQMFRTEIIWKRTNTHSDSKRWSDVSDSILYYGKSNSVIWNPPYAEHSEKYLETKYRYSDDKGRYRLDNMTSPSPRPNMMYEWKGFPSPPLGWRYSRETMTKLDEEGRIQYPNSLLKRPQLKRYLEQSSGVLMEMSGLTFHLLTPKPKNASATQPKARSSLRAHPKSLLQRRRRSPRSLLRLRNYRTGRTKAQPPLDRY